MVRALPSLKEHTDANNKLVKVSAEWTIFKTGVTVRVLMYSLVAVIPAFVLIAFAVDASRKFQASDPARGFFVGVPFLVGIILLVSLGVLYHHYLGREVRVKDEMLEYKDKNPKENFEVNIARMAYSPPREGRFRMLMISDGKKFVQLPEVFLGKEQFRALAEHIRKCRERRRHSKSSTTYSI
jgi:hypothetical protein